MEKDFSNLKEKFIGQQNIFGNSECLFVEYHDIISSPWFVLLMLIQKSEVYQQIMDLEPISKLNNIELYEWYCNRKNRNMYLDIAIKEKYQDMGADLALADSLLTGQVVGFFKELGNVNLPLQFFQVLNNIPKKERIVKRILVYTEFDESPMIERLKEEFNHGFEYIHGEFQEIVKILPQETTYIFSDMTKINTLKETDHLNYSVISVPLNYRYNFTPEDKSVPLVDIDSLLEDHVFKFFWFNNIPLSMDEI